MIRIKIHNGYSIECFIFGSTPLLGFIILFHLWHNDALILFLVNLLALIIIISLMMFFYYSKIEYISDICIHDNEINIVYKKCAKFFRSEIINKSDIQNFYIETVFYRTIFKNITFRTNFHRIIRRKITRGTTTVTITRNFDSPIIFSCNSYSLRRKLFDPKAFNFMLELIKYSNLIPNFKYELTGDEQIKEEAENYIKSLT